MPLDLPYTVDIVDLWSVNDAFAAMISESRVPLPASDGVS